MPFIANNGQVDEQVRSYAKTFCGTVFVMKDGENVYVLPEGRDVPSGASPSPFQQEAGALGCRWAMGENGRQGADGWYGQAPLVRVDVECVVANTYALFLRADNANCPPERVLANALLVAYPAGL